MIDLTRQARAYWRQAFATPWPRGWRCFASTHKSEHAWGYTLFEQKRIILYPHASEKALLRTLLHEFVHVYVDSHLHSKYFRDTLLDIERRLGVRERKTCLFELHLSP